MRGASVSDLHLGYRGVGRTEGGRNTREADVERAWAHAVDAICDARPQLVTIAGDVFHSVRPSFFAVRAFQAGIQKILRETEAVVIIIPGNHCQPRTQDTLTPSIVVESADPNRVLLVTEPRRVVVATDGGYASVDCLPFQVLGQQKVFTLEPDPNAEASILLVHAAVHSSAAEGAVPRMYAGENTLDVGALAEKYDVVAAGDFHQMRRLHPTRLAFYSGSIERTSSDIWKETEPKGVVLWDTAAGTFEFVEIPTRPMFDYTLHDLSYIGRPDLEPVAADVNVALESLLTESPIAPSVADSLCRMKVEDFRGSKDEIDWKLVSALKERCVHFLLDLRMAEGEVREFGDRRERQGRTLAEEAADFLAGDEEAVRERCLQLLGVE